MVYVFISILVLYLGCEALRLLDKGSKKEKTVYSILRNDQGSLYMYLWKFYSNNLNSILFYTREKKYFSTFGKVAVLYWLLGKCVVEEDEEPEE